MPQVVLLNIIKFKYRYWQDDNYHLNSDKEANLGANLGQKKKSKQSHLNKQFK